jgi:hypothetical protein
MHTYELYFDKKNFNFSINHSNLEKIILLLIMFKIHIQMKEGEVIIFNLFNTLDFTNFDVDENLFGFYLS